MLNDPTIARQNQSPETSERRMAERRPLSMEVVVRWHFDPSTPVRYKTIDISATGVQLESAAPLLEGMTGSLHMLVPCEDIPNGAVMVAWSRPSTNGAGYVAGLRFF